MKKYFTKFFHSGLGVVLSALFGIFLLRVITQSEGPEGLARFGIYRQFIQFCTVLLTWGNGFSIIESFSKSENKEYFLSNVYKYVLASTALMSIVVVVFSKQIAIGLYDDTTQYNLILVTPLIFIGIAHYSFFKFILSAKQHLLTSSFLQGLPFLLMFLFFYLNPTISTYFLLSYAACSVIGFFFFNYWSQEKISFSKKFQREIGFEKSSIVTVGTGTVGFLALLLVKSISVHYLGIKETGILEAEFSLMNYMTLAIIAGLSTFYLSAVSQDQNDINFREKIYIFLIPLTCICISVLIYYDHFFLGLLFGKDLLTYSPSLSIFGLAEMFRCINWFFIFTMIALSHRKKYILYDFISNVLYVLASLCMVIYFPNRMSIEMGYLVFQFAYFIFITLFCFKTKVINPKLSLGGACTSVFVIGTIIYLKNI